MQHTLDFLCHHKMILLYVLCFINVVLIQSSKNYQDCYLYFLECIESYEIPRTISNDFLKSKISLRSRYEESRETVETKREVNCSCILLIKIFHSHVLMNIGNKKDLFNVVIYYLHFVHNIAQKQWIVERIMVSLNQTERI
jgi:hypothetical protein